MPEIAKKIGVSKNTYQHYEYGTRKPSLAFIVAASHALGVSSDWLLGLSDERASGVSVTATGGSAVAAQSPGANVAATAAAPLSSEVTRLLSIIESQQRVIESLASAKPGAS